MSSKDDSAHGDPVVPDAEPPPMSARQIRQRYEDRLMSMPNVVGVDDTTDPNTRTGQIVVYVTRKVPIAELGPSDVVPKEVDGIQVRVEEIGFVTAHETEYPA